MTSKICEENPSIFEAMAWCNTHLDSNNPAGSLRSEVLKPELVILDDRTHAHWNYHATGDPVQAVVELVRRRAEVLKSSGLNVTYDIELNGKILLFYPYETLCDGVAHNESSGYFDFWNIPPWDTWIAYEKLAGGRHVLYSYVPPNFLAIAERGVRANPEKCIQWFEGWLTNF